MRNATQRNATLALGAFTLCCGLSIDLQATQDPDSLPSYYHDKGMGACFLRQEQGQTFDTDGNVVTDVLFYFEHSPVGIYLRDKSTVSFTMARTHNDSLGIDSLYRVDMNFGHGDEAEPEETGSAVGGKSNFYRGGSAVEAVKAYDQAVYRSVWDSINVYFYRSKGGPRMAITVLPGGDPADISLKFNGQDSIGVDWEGALRLYVGERWIKLEEAMAYQVEVDGSLLPVTWTPYYTHEPGDTWVTFEFSDYNDELPLIFQVGYPPMPMGGGSPRNLEWSTFVGGEGADELTSVELDEDGDPYACGYSFSSYFPADPGLSEFDPFIDDIPGFESAVIMKFNSLTKQISWATYYGGTRTQAHKLDPYKGPATNRQYVFVSGSTSDIDFDTHHEPLTIFSAADDTEYLGGITRVWIAAFTKLDGQRHWASTYGQTDGNTWGIHGLAVDVDESGRLVVAGQLEAFQSQTVTPDPQWVTPSGGFNRATGDGFFMYFDANYGVYWSSAFLASSQQNVAYGRINDVRFTTTPDNHPGFVMVGASVGDSPAPMDVDPPPAGGFYQSDASSIYTPVVAVMDIQTLDIEYCTYWANSGSAYGVYTEPGKPYTWVVGFTQDNEIDPAILPAPPAGLGPVLHDDSHNGSPISQWSDGFILRFDNTSYALDYGTLVGGNRDDILLDVNSDGAQYIFITGETRSSSGFAQDMNPDLYYQDEFNFVNRRDGFILTMRNAEHPEVLWRTAYAGNQTDRGWGIANTAEEIYLVGSTASQFGSFPLFEFNTDVNSPDYLLDYYQDINYGGESETGMVPWQEFWHAMDYEWDPFGETALEPPHSPCDAYIASFGIPIELITASRDLDPKEANALQAWTIDGGNNWQLGLPAKSNWTIRVFDATGRLTVEARSTSAIGRFSIAGQASGMYAVSASDGAGVVLHTKILKP